MRSRVIAGSQQVNPTGRRVGDIWWQCRCMGAAVFPFRRTPQFIVQMNDSFEWPRGSGSLTGYPRCRSESQIRNECLKAARYVAETFRLCLELFYRLLVKLP